MRHELWCPIDRHELRELIAHQRSHGLDLIIRADGKRIDVNHPKNHWVRAKLAELGWA